MTWLVQNPIWRLLPGNPIFVRVVETAAKRGRHAAIRITYIGALLAVTMVLVLKSLGGGQSLTALSRQSAFIFTIISFVQLAMACLMAPVFVAGAITQEKDSQTYSVLLTTPLSNAQIVLGSLMSRLFFVLMLLASGIPVFLITQLFGGVTGSSILLSFMIAAATATFTGALAVTIAVIRVGTGRTIFAFYLAVGLYLAAVWLLAALPIFALPGISTNYLTALHPFLSLMVVLNITAAPDPAVLSKASGLARFWLCWPHYAFVCWTMGCSLLLVLLGTIFVRWSHARTRVDWRRLLSFVTGGRLVRHPRSVWNNPVAWREAATSASAGGRGMLRWLFLILGLTAGFILWISYAWSWLSPATTRTLLQSILWVELTVVLLVLCNVSASAITREREDGTLDLLLVTPITSRYYLWGKLRGLVSFAAILLLAPVVTVVLLCLQDVLKPPMADPAAASTSALAGLPIVSWAAVIAIALTMLSFCALAIIVALNMSLKVRKTVSAVMGTVAIVGVVGMAGSLCGLSLGSMRGAGPLIAMVSPYIAINLAVSPHSFGQVGGSLPPTAWWDLQYQMLIFAIIICAALSLIVWGMYNSMVRTFDMIIRRQSK